MSLLIAIGGAVLRVVGLNPDRISTRSEGRVPGKPTFGGMDYQVTGLGERVQRLAFVTVPIVTGGLDTLAILQAIHQRQSVVPFLRLGRAYAATMVGTVVVRSLDVEEGHIHPATGVGRRVSGEAELLIVGGGAGVFGGSIGIGVGGGSAVAAGLSLATTAAKIGGRFL